MSAEDSNPVEKLPDLTKSEVDEFLKEQAGSCACSVCGNEEMTLEYVKLTSEPERIFGAFFIPAALPFEFEGDNSGKKVKTMPNMLGGRAVLLAICTRCANVRLLDYRTIWGWVLNRRASSSADKQAGQ